MLPINKLMTFAVAAALGLSCAGPSTTVDAVWTSPTARAQPRLQKVVTIFLSENLTMRHAGEDRLARDLAMTGVQATPGYKIFGDRAQDKGDIEAMKTQLRSMGYDGVVTMRIVDREQTVESTPSSFDTYWGYWGHGYYGGGYGYGWPGYVYTETTYRLEAAAYSLNTGELVWSQLTSTVDPDDMDELIEDTTEVIAGDLRRRGLSG
jgi:hypothetical protein